MRCRTVVWIIVPVSHSEGGGRDVGVNESEGDGVGGMRVWIE